MRFYVTMRRTQTARVLIDAPSEHYVRKELRDQEVRWEHFAAHGDAYQSGDITIVRVEPEPPTE